MSPRSSSNQGPYRKPRADVYTVLLIIALVAILLSVLFLHLEVKDMPHEGGSSASLVPDLPPQATAVACSLSPVPHGRSSAERFTTPVHA